MPRTVRGFCARGDACHYQHDAFAWTGPAVPAFGRPPPQLSTLPFAHPRHLPQTALPALEASTLRPDRVQQRPPPSRSHASRPARGASRVISVENIPAPSLTDAAVRHFFAPFGQICDLSLDLERRAATVTFATPAQADRAVSSPQAVFGNRFVRVYRANDRGLQGSQDMDRTSPPSTDTSPFPAQAMSSTSTRAPHQAKSRSPDAGDFLRDSAAQQRHLLDEFERADKERRRAILADLRRLAAEAESARQPSSVETAATQVPVGSEPREHLEKLRREVRPRPRPFDELSCASSPPSPLCRLLLLESSRMLRRLRVLVLTKRGHGLRVDTHLHGHLRPARTSNSASTIVPPNSKLARSTSSTATGCERISR